MKDTKKLEEERSRGILFCIKRCTMKDEFIWNGWDVMKWFDVHIYQNVTSKYNSP